MTSNTKARFWKCALQVNPVSYAPLRGINHGMSEEEYNAGLVRVAIENNIKIIGLAHHGNVSSVNSIRDAMKPVDIITFPGFEISSSEKIHFVCLYAEETTDDELQRYLGDLGLLTPEDGITPSCLSSDQIINKVVRDQKGFIYAAHCTHTSGILKERMSHIWKNPLLQAIQIPGSIDDLKGLESDFYRKAILNKEAAYERDHPMAVINAKDVVTPEDLADPNATCLIKMTIPNFEAFKLAFHDPGSRVHLNRDAEDQFYSRLESLTVTGGFLDTLDIEFSEHLNAVIGGRGTGKSTLLECIRFVLGIHPIGSNAQKQHDAIIKENLGKSKARVELNIRSSAMNGQYFTVARRYGEDISVQDSQGNPSSFQPADLLPTIEFFGQNEIYEIAQSKNGLRRLLERFLESGHGAMESVIGEALNKLAENRKLTVESRNSLAAIEDQVARLPKIEERLEQFKQLGVEEKLKSIPLLEKSKRLLERAVKHEGPNLETALLSVKDNLPDTAFLSDAAIAELPQAEVFHKIRQELDALQIFTENILVQWQEEYSKRRHNILMLADQTRTSIHTQEEALENIFKELPACEGKSGQEIGLEYQKLLKEIEYIRPLQSSMTNQQKLSDSLLRQRQAIHAELSEYRADRSASFARTLARLNKKLAGKLRLGINPEADRKPVIDFLLNCRLENVGAARLDWIYQASDFSAVKLAGLIRQGSTALKNAGWGITPTVADALSRMSFEQILQLEEIESPDEVEIELNISHNSPNEYRPLSKLSTGQQCTAILHLLLLENKDPLIMDQPEDNLDNAFIADRIVAELRDAKISRQFIFATHNANIPVFGDAEWIGVFDSIDNMGRMPEESQGAIDVPAVRDKAAEILEGGKDAFLQRKYKYGY